MHNDTIIKAWRASACLSESICFNFANTLAYHKYFLLSINSIAKNRGKVVSFCK